MLVGLKSGLQLLQRERSNLYRGVGWVFLRIVGQSISQLFHKSFLLGDIGGELTWFWSIFFESGLCCLDLILKSKKMFRLGSGQRRNFLHGCLFQIRGDNVNTLHNFGAFLSFGFFFCLFEKGNTNLHHALALIQHSLLLFPLVFIQRGWILCCELLEERLCRFLFRFNVALQFVHLVLGMTHRLLNVALHLFDIVHVKHGESILRWQIGSFF
mmetsp:Transcript_6146/g.12624  ORF Transcript_6146/g.12624 Transcript_6146/m.12624 type:complete len:213 (+) Transcript_6146:4026-4664(+)